MSPSPLCRVCRQVPPLLPDGWVLEHCEASRLLHHQIGRDPGRLGLPLQAERPLPQPEGWVPSGSGSPTALGPSPWEGSGGCPRPAPAAGCLADLPCPAQSRQSQGTESLPACAELRISSIKQRPSPQP